MTKLRLYFASGIVAGLGVLAWVVRAWWRRGKRESAKLDLGLRWPTVSRASRSRRPTQRSQGARPR